MERVSAVVIGAGPAGLATAACLKRQGIAPVVLDRTETVGSAWRGHYDRLHLHTARGRSNLPFRPMPSQYGRYPSRVQMIEYLEDYARAEALEIRLGCSVGSVRPQAAGWRVVHSGGETLAETVVLATGLNATPHRPDWPGQEGFPGPILHSSGYRTPADVAGQRVLVVGLGNSGGDIALDLAEAGRDVSIAVRGPVNILPHELFGIPITSMGLLRKLMPYRMADSLTAPLLRAKIGKPEDYGLRSAGKGPAAQVIEDGRIPLIDIGTLPAIKAGQIATRSGIARFDGATVTFDDGTTADFDAVVLATGYRVDLRHLLPETPEVLDREGRPKVSGGPSGAEGLYFCSYKASADGQLRQIGIEARAIAALAAQAAARKAG